MHNFFAVSDAFHMPFDFTGSDDEKESTISIVLNGFESDIIFVNVSTADEFQVSGKVIIRLIA